MHFEQAEVDHALNSPVVIRLLQASARTDAAKADLIARFGWDERDARIDLLNGLLGAQQSAAAAMMFRKAIFCSQDFWRPFFGATVRVQDHANHDMKFDMLVRFAFFQGIASISENSLRNLVRGIAPGHLRNGRDKLFRVWNWAKQTLPAASNYDDFAKLVRLSRNTIHNDGVHMPENGQSDVVNWRGTAYAFNDSTSLDFLSWDFVIDVSDEIRAMQTAIFQEPASTAVPVIPRNNV